MADESSGGTHTPDVSAATAAPLSDYLTLAEAASLLGMHPATLGQQARAGKLRTARLGRLYVTTAAWLDAYRARYAGQRGRPDEADARALYTRRATALLALDRRRKPESIARASVAACVDTLWKYPDTDPARLREIVAAHRETLLRREAAAARAMASSSIVEAALASPGIDGARYAAERAFARRAPSALGRRWLELFHAALASADEDVTPRNLGVIARLDQRVAQALAEELLGTEPPAPALDCRAQLMRAMLEGSMNLPPESAACREMIEHTVERGMRLATAALRHRRATGDAGAQASA